MNISEYCQKYKVSRDKAEFELREREVHKVDIAQPGSELWDKAWAEKAKKRKEQKEKREREAENHKHALEEKQKREAGKIGVPKKRIYI